MSNIIKDLRTLNAIEKQYGLKFDKEYKHCINAELEDINKTFTINNNNYILSFIPCCIYPFIQRKEVL